MSENQGKMIDQYAETLGIPAWASQQGKLGLTFGQAGSLLNTLSDAKDYHYNPFGMPYGAAWLARAVLEAQKDVPIVMEDVVDEMVKDVVKDVDVGMGVDTDEDSDDENDGEEEGEEEEEEEEEEDEEEDEESIDMDEGEEEDEMADDEDEGDSEAGPATPSYAHFKERESAGGFAPQPTVTQNYPKDGAYLKCALLSPVDLDSF